MRPTKRLQKKIDKCIPVYLIACWAHYGVREYKWTGKWVNAPGSDRPCPEVWYYDDHNGEYEEYYKTPILNVTTGWIIDWSFYKRSAEKIAEALNLLMEKNGGQVI